MSTSTSWPAPMVEGRSGLRWMLPVGGLVLLVVLFLQLGPSSILALFVTLGANLFVVCAIFACHECVRALALDCCLGPGHHPPFRRLLFIRFMGEGVRTLTHGGPLIAEPARAWLLARDAIEGARAFGAAVSEFLANSLVSALVMIAILGFVLQTADVSRPLAVISHLLLWSSFLYVSVAVVALANRIYLIGALARAAASLPLVGRRLATDPARVRRMEDTIFHVLRDDPRTLASIVLLELTAQGILIVEIYWTIRAMGVELSPWTAILVEALTKVPNTIQFVGAAEGGYALVFDWLGMTAAVGFTLSIVKRLRSVLVAALGLAVLVRLDRSLWPRGRQHSPLEPGP